MSTPNADHALDLHEGGGTSTPHGEFRPAVAIGGRYVVGENPTWNSTFGGAQTAAEYLTAGSHVVVAEIRKDDNVWVNVEGKKQWCLVDPRHLTPAPEPVSDSFRQSNTAEPSIVCLCGSTRFRTEFVEANRALTMVGKIVVAPGVFQHDGDPLTEDEKAVLDLLHLQKIDLADEVFVVNPGGYIGDSTKREIEYARRIGKPVSFLDAEAADTSSEGWPDAVAYELRDVLPGLTDRFGSAGVKNAIDLLDAHRAHGGQEAQQ